MFDYAETNAELYITAKYDRWSRTPMTYRRFETLALAIAFACEERGIDLSHTTIRTDVIDMHGADIRRCYDAQDFPLPRHPRKKRGPARSDSSAAFKQEAG
jgi:hypothetical protein